MREGVILSGANLVPLGNNLFNGIREKTKERGRSKLPISGKTRKAFEKRVCCVGSFNSRSLNLRSGIYLFICLFFFPRQNTGKEGMIAGYRSLSLSS